MLFFSLVSLAAGVLTLAAPCVLPLLPVVIGRSAGGHDRPMRPVVIAAALAASVVLSTLVLKASATFVAVPPRAFAVLGGGLVALFGVAMLAPSLLGRAGAGKLAAAANRAVGRRMRGDSYWADLALGVALGPLFSTCSPTFLVIVGTVLPASWAEGAVYTALFAAGAALPLAAIGYATTGLSAKLAAWSGSRAFRAAAGAAMLLAGLAMATGADKAIEAALVSRGFTGVTSLERGLLDRAGY